MSSAVELSPGAEAPTTEVETAVAAPARTQARVLFVDLLRLVASFQMIQGHTLDALMAEELRSGPVFDRWTFSRGLVSVGFMFAAGIAFSLSTLERFERHRTDPRTRFRRFRRIAWLVTLGYLLHFPVGAFGGDPASVTRALHELAIADVLQCIGLSVLALQVAVLTLPSRRHVVVAALVLTAAVFSLAPLTETVSPEGPFRFALNYLTHEGGSLFPLFPWSGYVFAGVVAAAVVLPDGARTEPAKALPRLAAMSAVTLGLGLALYHLSPFGLGAAETPARSLPSYALIKLGCVMVVVTLLAALSLRVRRLPAWLATLAGESLMLYAFHLLVLYGGYVGLRHVVGHTLPLHQALGVVAALMVVTGAVALGWSRFKAWWRPRAPRWLA